MSRMSTFPNEEEQHRERDCPLCGSTTSVIDSLRTPNRTCDNPDCNWGVAISPSSRRAGWTKGRRISDLEERVDELERLVREHVEEVGR